MKGERGGGTCGAKEGKKGSGETGRGAAKGTRKLLL